MILQEDESDEIEVEIIDYGIAKSIAIYHLMIDF